jgi:NitT/TauT family transport system ATP-binding protein
MINKGTSESPGKLTIHNISKTFFLKNRTGRCSGQCELGGQEGEFICLVGPSGCGKTTLLNIIAGLDRPDSGEVLEDGVPIADPGQDRLVMFQESALFPWLSVLGNVMYGLKLKSGLSKAARRDLAEHFLKMVGLEKFSACQRA